MNTFQQVVKQVQKNSGIIEQVVYAIAGTQIISEPEEGAEVFDLQEFYEQVTQPSLLPRIQGIPFWTHPPPGLQSEHDHAVYETRMPCLHNATSIATICNP